MQKFAEAIIVSIDRNADVDSVTAQTLEEEESPEEFDYDRHDQIETCAVSYTHLTLPTILLV